MIFRKALLLWLFAFVWANAEAESETEEPEIRPPRHTNNWAVLVSTSRFWFNYRHMANVLSFYRTVKRLGIPDSQIIVMLSDDVSCNPRNPFVGSVYKDHEHDLDLYGSNIEVDYRGYEVTVENFVRLLTDRWDDEMPRSKRLMTDDRSNVLVYLTGHGGDDFLKFQDADEIGAWDLADAFGQMWEKRRYNELLFMIDTCEANTMYSKMFSPNIIAVGSSQIEESSYANSSDEKIGVALIDRFTNFNARYLEKVNKTSDLTLADLFDSYDPKEISSHPGIRQDLFPYALNQVRITDFFGNIQEAVVEDPTLDLGMDLNTYRQQTLEEPQEQHVLFENQPAKPSGRHPAHGSQQVPRQSRPLLGAAAAGLIAVLFIGCKLA